MSLLNKVNLGFQLWRNMGSRYVGYRVRHELDKKLGRLVNRHPVHPDPKSWMSVDAWKKSPPKFFFQSRKDLDHARQPTDSMRDKAQKILAGNIQFFSDEWLDLGEDYDWVTNPITGFRYNNSQHWSKIQDFDLTQGDIKYVWEKSRFSYLLTILRYDYHFDQDHSAFVFSQMEDWIAHNPVNQGPNWRCSQEISLRIINWCFVLYFYKDSPELTGQRWDKIQHVIYWSLHHVYHHIDFSRIAVRNNHAITETLMLTVSELLFPFIPETKKWSKKGRGWFEKEIRYQVYADGTFLQFSMNYHRVLVQLLSFGLALTENHQKPFSETVYTRARASVNFLFQCQNEKDGFLQNYGSNDGALFFPLADQQYGDYRPQLSCLYRILSKKDLYIDGGFEEQNWIKSNNDKALFPFQGLQKHYGLLAFKSGGYFLIREKKSLTFIRCGNHKDRPLQADNLHLDIFESEENILYDAGSYKYNAIPEILRYFTGTLGHNTVTLDRKDQMLKGSRFIWFYWTQQKSVRYFETDTHFVFEGEIQAFTYLKAGITHRRKVSKKKGESIWEIEDEVNAAPAGLKMLQHWHVSKLGNLEIYSQNRAAEPVKSEKEDSFRSECYGRYTKEEMITFSSETHFLRTTISVKD